MLAIEMSQRDGGIALATGDGSVIVRRASDAKHRDDSLMPAIDDACRAAGITPEKLDAIAVSIGPGGFTGLRIAISAVKMLALTLGVRVVAVPTALIVAERLSWDSLDGDAPQVLITLAAKRSTCWITPVIREPGLTMVRCRMIDAGRLVEAADVDLDSVAAVVGDRYLPAMLRERARARGLPIIEPTFDPTACLDIGARMLEAGQVTHPDALLPMYPRDPEAVRLWDEKSSN